MLDTQKTPFALITKSNLWPGRLIVQKIGLPLLLAVVIFMASLHECAVAQAPPHLEKRNQATQLMIDGKPFLILGGELYNSSASSLAFMAPLWEPLKNQGLNTVLVSVSWQLIEPSQGKFDFTLVDGLIKGARQNKLKVVLLWFGTWKNGLSHYVPDWVKRDTQTYPRIQLENGKSTETISNLCLAACQSDAKAFAALMHHVRQIDAIQKTVLMVQVENEVGILGSTRDHSMLANTAFSKPVPLELMESLDKNRAQLQPELQKAWKDAGGLKSGTWEEVFGKTPRAAEFFTAWNYATYVNRVARAGKAEYPIPMYVNTWLVQPEDKQPGDYPSGGPQSQVHDIWRVAAPSIDLFSPDVYLPDFKGVAARYVHSWNTFFIPESYAGEAGAENAFYTVGKYKGIGYSPFGIDQYEVHPAQTPMAKAYHVLQQLTPEILKAQAAGKIDAVILNQTDSVQTTILGGYKLIVSLKRDWSGKRLASRGYALIINSGPDAFTLSGSNVDVMFVPVSAGPEKAGISSLWEGTYENGIWKPGRLLNGDDILITYNLAEQAAANRTGTGVKLNQELSIQRLKLYRF